MNAIQSDKGQFPRVVSKPNGGFRPITVLQVCMAWWAYRTGILPRYMDFRVYLALHEIQERRLAAGRVRARNGKAALQTVMRDSEVVDEVRTLIGGTGDRLVKQAIRQLKSVGLINFSTASFSFATSGDSLRLGNSSDLKTVLDRFSSRSDACARRLPVPRPMLRYLAGGATPTVAATVLGYLIRCVWWRGRECHVSGACTAGFISDLFGVDVRSVKRARAELRKIGWLVVPDEISGYPAKNLMPNLLWVDGLRSRNYHSGACSSVLSPPAPIRGTKMSPPTRSIQLRSGSKYQQPDLRGQPGVYGGAKRGLGPRLCHVVPDDLRDARRLLVLFEQAALDGLVKRTEADRLRFFSAAERAKRIATRNPCGFFAAIIRNGRWEVLSQVDEDLAHSVVKHLELAEDSPGDTGQLGSLAARNKKTAAEPHDADERVERIVAQLASKCSMAPAKNQPEVRSKAVRRQLSLEDRSVRSRLHVAGNDRGGNMNPAVLACGAGPCRPSLTPRETSDSELGDGRQGATRAGSADGLSEV